MKKTAISIIIILLALGICYVGWKLWDNHLNEERVDELEMPHVAQDTVPKPIEAPVTHQYTPWNSLSWRGQHLSGTQATHLLEVFSKQLNLRNIGEICQPEYALYFRHVTDENYNARPATILLKINSILCSTGRKNDNILSLYAHLRQFKNLITSKGYHYINLLHRSYSLYCQGNASPNENLLQQAYASLRKGKSRSVSDKLKPVLGDSFIKDLAADGYKIEEIEWACSFWPRRASEKNIYALYAIVKDLLANENMGTPGFAPGSLTHESIPANKTGLQTFRSYHLSDGSLKCTYSYDRHGKRTGNWVLQPTNSKKVIECRMDNDVPDGAYVIWLPNQSARYIFNNGHLDSKAFYRQQRLIFEDFYQRELRNKHIAYHYYPSGELYKTETWIKSYMAEQVIYNEDGSVQASTYF